MRANRPARQRCNTLRHIELAIDSAQDGSYRGGSPLPLEFAMQKILTSAPIAPTDSERMLYRQTVELYAFHDPSMEIGRVWDAVRHVDANADQVAEALSTCLDWNKGIAYAPEWFPAEFPQWWTRADMDVMEADRARDEYRRRLLNAGICS